MKNTRSIKLALLFFIFSAVAFGARFDPAKPAGMAGGRGDFSFAVLADVQEPPIFKDKLGWINTIDGDFYVIAGDDTPGYTDRAGQVVLWKGFEGTANKLHANYVMVPGNHDTSNAESEALWRERYGPLWFSWNHKGCHFIALDSNESGKEGLIRDQQLEWLKKDLAGAKDARATFVFIHHPLWFPNYKSKEWNADVHPLLAKAGVDYVFCGHEHHYVLCEKRDGVQYVMLGPTAAITGASFSSFINALLVEVKGSVVSYRLLSPEGERPADFYTRDVDLRAVRPMELEPVVKIGKNRPVELVVAVANPSNDKPIQAIVGVNPGTGSWKAARAEKAVAAGKRERIAIKTRTGDSILPLPTILLEIRAEDELVVKKEALPLIAARIPGLKERIVDDFNDGDDLNSCDKSQISLRSGSWSKSVDQYGSSRMEMTFTDGALHVAGVKGKSTAPNYTFANFHTELAAGERINLAGSTGISFRARSDKGGRWEVGLGAVVGGKKLGGTGREHRAKFETGKEWKEYRFLWREFSQPDWVTAADRVSPLTVDAAEALFWNQPEEGADFDLWLDDVRLVYE